MEWKNRIMNENEATRNYGEGPRHRPYQVRLPGFLIEEETGLGDVIKRITYTLGIKPCDGCEQRAAILNRWVNFRDSSLNTTGRFASDKPFCS